MNWREKIDNIFRFFIEKYINLYCFYIGFIKNIKKSIFLLKININKIQKNINKNSI